MQLTCRVGAKGRAVDTATGEIVATGTVEFTNLKHLDGKLQELAYQLSGDSEREHRKTRFAQEISRHTLGALAGVAIGYDIDLGLGYFPIVEGSRFPREGTSISCIGGTSTSQPIRGIPRCSRS